MVLHGLYRDLRQMHAPFPSERDKRYFDDLRQIQINLPVFSDVIIFQLDKEPLVSKIDREKWRLNVKNEENWKVMGACKVLLTLCEKYKGNYE